jgi:hypothetical protein
LLDKVLDLLTGGLSERLRAAEVDSIGFHEFGIELLPANDLAEAVANLGAGPIAIAVPISMSALGREFLARRWDRANLLDRADADSISFAEGAINRPSFCDPHLGPADKGRNIGWIGIAVADEAYRTLARINRRFEDEAVDSRVAESGYGLDVDPAAFLPTGETNKACVRDVPPVI